MKSIWLGVILLCCQQVLSVIPAGILKLHGQYSTGGSISTEMFVAPSSQSGWGPRLPPNSTKYHDIKFAQDGCSPLSDDYKDSYVLADRGNCSFLDKAIHASKSGAAGIIIRNTREAVYYVDRNRSTTGNLSDASNTVPSFATNCGYGEDYVAKLNPSTPWIVDDTICSENSLCASNICIPTGAKDNSKGYQICCMWDTHLLMGVNYTVLKQASLDLSIVFATVAEGENITSIMSTASTLQGSLLERPTSLFGFASLILWALGIFTAVGGAYYAARVERLHLMNTKPHAHADDVEYMDDEVLDVSFRHALYFIIFAGLFLTFLYFIHVGPLLSIMFGLSAVSTFTMLVVQPLYQYIFCCLQRFILRCPLGPLPLPDLLATLSTLALVVLWYLDRATWWYLQDVFGVALCFVFLRTIRLPTLQVASVLLILAFFYDIFFVFITPLIFGRSVMVDVASGGPSASSKAGYPGSDFCERYPKYDPCIDPEPLPMLLIFPRLFDWRGGQAMLGLGDIVLPGLLLCFALRFDYSRQVRLKETNVMFHRYYLITCIGYCVGLFCANLAVALMEMGQPALLYLVPFTLGGISITAYFSGDLHQMWNHGPYPVHPMAPTLASPMDLEGGEKSPFLHE